MTTGPGERPRRRLSAADRRAQILQAALTLFAYRDVSTVAVEEVAAEAGVSPALVHHYFGTRDDLVHAALEAAAEEIAAKLEDLAPGTPAEVLAAGLETYLDFISEQPAAWSALLRAGATGGPAKSVRIARRADDAALRTALRALEEPDPVPALVISLRGWLGSLKEASQQWVSLGSVGRDVLYTVLAVSFHGALQAAAAADASAQPALDRFEGRTTAPVAQK